MKQLKLLAIAGLAFCSSLVPSAPAVAQTLAACVSVARSDNSDYWVNNCNSGVRMWYWNQFGSVGLVYLDPGEWQPMFRINGNVPMIKNVCHLDDHRSTSDQCSYY